MANTYATLEAVKGPSALNIAGSGEDGRLTAVTEAASRLIDRHCNRHFHTTRATRRFDGNRYREVAAAGPGERGRRRRTDG